jgi:voltage-gated potassium channel Kch
MTKPTVSERFRYWFDGWMSRGPIALIALLGLATAALVLVVSGLVWLFTLFGQYPNDNPDLSPAEILWGNLMRSLDSGAMGGDTGWGFRILMLVLTLGGLIIVASLIGIVSGGFDAKVEDLRKGRSRVLETDHTLILGFSSKVFPIVAELCVANQSRRRSAIVILAPRDKVEMEDELRALVGRTGTTKIICRTGDPMNPADLEISSPQTARSIIILGSQDSSDADSDVIKTALALTNSPRRKPGKYHIVAELVDEANLEAAKLVGKDEAHWVLASDLISRITVQSCRQSGLSVVYSELLDFGGDEIYFTDQPALHGKTYFDAQCAFDTSAVLGIIRDEKVLLNPASETVLGSGDRLIVIAGDDSTIRLAAPGVVDASAVSSAKPAAAHPERTLVLGYNAGLGRMLRELNEYVAKGSSVTIVADVEQPEFEAYDKLALGFSRADSTSRAVLDGLAVASFDHIIVLAYRDTCETQRADGKTLITLLQLRDIEGTTGANLSVVSEMLDDRNRELAEVTNADDFIVSDKLISLVLSQVSENRELTLVFDELFSSRGSEIYLNPVEHYVTPGADIDFYAVLEAARRRGETAIGYRVAADFRDEDRGYGVTVNPLKTARRRYSAGDKVIVLAQG